MATDFGTDVDATVDVPLRWGLCSGTKNLGNALVRRLLFLRDYINAGLTPTQYETLRSRIQNAVEEEPRVQSLGAVAFVAPDAAGGFVVKLGRIATAAGPFSLVLGVTAMTVEILNNGVATAAQAVAASTLALPIPGPAGAPGGPGPTGAQGATGAPGSGGGGGGGFTFREETSSSAGTEEVVDQLTVDFSNYPGGTLTLELAARFASAVGTATFKVRVGGNYDAADGTVVITGTAASPTFGVGGFSGTLTNPTGLRAVKLTITSSGAGVAGYAKEGTLTVTS